MAKQQSFFQTYAYKRTPGGEQKVDRVQAQSYPCGKCGGRTYTLTAFNMWECSTCKVLFPFLARTDHLRPQLETVNSIKPCKDCFSPWLMKSTKGDFFCPECNPRPRDQYSTLVCAGGSLK